MVFFGWSWSKARALLLLFGTNKKYHFLSLIYILYIKSKNDINNVYIQICNHLHLDPEKYHFDDIYNEFNYRVNYTDVFTFSHPSYEEGLIESWNIPEIQNLYLKIIRILKDDPDPIVRGLCGLCLIKNYSKLWIFKKDNNPFKVQVQLEIFTN